MNEMEELLEQIRKAVADVREKGQQVVNAAALDAYLVELKETATLTREERDRQHQSQLEQFKASQASNLAYYGAKVQHGFEMLRGTLAAGQEALKAAMLVNGGAAVAVLGFLSNAATKSPPAAMLVHLPLSLLFFAFGALATAVAAGLTYLSQALFAMGRDRIATAVRIVITALVVGSYVAFALGAPQAYAAFR